jgi:hypothetical protein
MSTATYYEGHKDKKSAISTFVRGARFNHPHRLKTVSLSGTIDYVRDERDFAINASPSNGDIAFRDTLDLDLSAASAWSRYFEEKCPFSHTLDLAVREFALLHGPGFPWKFFQQINFDPDFVVIGTITRENYTYNDTTSSWDLTSTDLPEDVECNFSFSVTGGGDPVSGGFDSVSAAEIELTVDFDYIGSYGSLLLGWGWGLIERLPWTEVWDPETDIFSDSFDLWVDDLNTATGGGHSGSCSMTLNFSNV